MARPNKKYFRLNDESWADLLTCVDDACSIHSLSSASGPVAAEECKIVRGFIMQIAAGTSTIITNRDETTGRIEINFDGMAPMTGRGSFDTDNRAFRRNAEGVIQTAHNVPSIPIYRQTIAGRKTDAAKRVERRLLSRNKRPDRS